MKIRVTRADLKGEYTDPKDCPIARAVIRSFPGFQIHVSPKFVFIGLDTYFLSRSDNAKAYKRSGSIWGLIMGGFTINLIKT